MMHVAFIDHRLNLWNGGGSNLSLHHMATTLTDLGHQVSVITVAPVRNAIPDRVSYEVIERPLTESFAGLRAKLRLVSILREMERRVDIFQLEGSSFILAGALYRLLGGSKPVVARLNNYSFFCTNIPTMDADCWRRCTLIDRFAHRPISLRAKLVRLPFHLFEQASNRVLANRLDRYIAMSPAVAQIHARFGIDSSRTVVISSPLDYTTLSRGPRTVPVALRGGKHPFRILYAGRLNTQKGVDLLLRAVADLEFSFILDVAGDGPQRDQLQALANELGISDRVTFHGWVTQDEVIDFCLASQLFVHPGRWPEPSGRAVMDAVVLGVPLIVSDAGGPPWVAGKAALTFVPEDVGDLRDKIRAVYRDPALAARLSSSSKEWVKQFDRRNIANQLAQLYAQLCGNGDSPESSVTVAPALQHPIGIAHERTQPSQHD